MRAMILAAGLGTRLRPLTLAAPKPSLPLCNLPQLRYQLRMLQDAGVTEVALNLHYLPEVIPTLLGDGKRLGLSLTYSHEPQILGTGGGLKKVATFLSAPREPFFVINGDTLIDLDLRAVLDTHRKSGAQATMVLREDPQMLQYGALGVDDTGRIRDFIGRTVIPGEVVRRGLFTGVHLLEPDVLELLPEGNSCINRTVYPALMQAGAHAGSHFQTGFWSDVGTPERYLEANLALLEGALPRLAPLMLEQSQREGEALLGAGVSLGAGVRLHGGVVVGPRATIGAQASLERVVVWADASVPPGMRLRNAVVWQQDGQSQVFALEGIRA